jgi:hypothetical protein
MNNTNNIVSNAFHNPIIKKSIHKNTQNNGNNYKDHSGCMHIITNLNGINYILFGIRGVCDKNYGKMITTGGKYEEHDNDMRTTAIRECREEMGIIVENKDIIFENNNGKFHNFVALIPFNEIKCGHVDNNELLNFGNKIEELNIKVHKINAKIGLLNINDAIKNINYFSKNQGNHPIFSTILLLKNNKII